ncbi:hypothetical protein IJM16_04730 [Candidatus Saccharibacteria bacterium]|nr:hypothetical protein [Candidatus Saccharibacteria bacterium]
MEEQQQPNDGLTIPKPEKGTTSAYVGSFLMILLAPGALISFVVAITSLFKCTSNYSLGCTYGLMFEWIIYGVELAISVILLILSLINRKRPIHRVLWIVELSVVILLVLSLGFSIYPEVVFALR